VKKKTIVSIAIITAALLFTPLDARCQSELKFSRERAMMVQKQLEARGITDKEVLRAMRKVKRHLFVPLAYRVFAYADTPWPIGHGQTISQPYIVALMTELLALKGDEKVLEIGTGSGYQAAILAELAKEVYSIEILKPLAGSAQRRLKELGYKNIRVKYGDGFLGWPEQAPFDAIIVTCAPEEVPAPLLEQLAEGGRLVIPVGTHWQELKILQKKEGKILVKSIIPVRFVPMMRKEISALEVEDKELTENLKRHVRVLSGEIGERNFGKHKNLERAADYIRQEFINFGYAPEEQIYHLEGKPYRNIIAAKKGRVSPEREIIVCAHYDSVTGSPGADDNASGVAGLLELARLLYNEELNKTVKFIAFTNEEPPYFMTDVMGSFRYAQEARKRKDKIQGVLCLESIGYYSDKKGSQSYTLGLGLFYPDKGNFISVVSNFSSRNLLSSILKNFKKKSSFPIEGLVGSSFLLPPLAFSDHWSFWKFGYKAVMVTDTAFFRNPYYHMQDDIPEKLNYESMSAVASGLFEALLKLSN